MSAYIVILPTFPRTSVDLDTHAQRAFVRAVRHDADLTGDDGRLDLAQHRVESVTVAREHL